MPSTATPLTRAKDAVERRFPSRPARIGAAIGAGCLCVALLIGFIGRSATLDTGSSSVSMGCGSPFAPADLASLELSPPGADSLLGDNIVTLCNRSILTGRWMMAMIAVLGLCALAWAVTRPEPAPEFRGDPIL